jgi:cytochrome P450
MTEATLQYFDDPAVMTAATREAAASAPTAIAQPFGAVYVFGYHEVDRLLHDQRLAGVGLSFFDAMGIADGPLRRWYGGLMFTNEGAAHHRLRRLVAKAFTPSSVERLRSIAASFAEGRLDVEPGSEGDLVAMLHDLPMAVMCRLLGIPDDEVEQFVQWLEVLSRVFGIMDPQQIAEAEAAIEPMLANVAAVVAKRASTPTDDLITALVHAEHDGDRLTRDETVAMVANLLAGGHDTTASQIGCSLYTLLAHPGSLATIDADTTGTLLASAVSETVRFEPSLAVAPRTVLEPVDVGGVERPVGAMVMLCTLTANRDPDVWVDPEVLQLDRFTHPGTPKLLSFGAGTHYCLGAALARMTLEEAVRSTARRRPTLTVDPRNVAWTSVLGRSPAHLPVTFA